MKVINVDETGKVIEDLSKVKLPDELAGLLSKVLKEE